MAVCCVPRLHGYAHASVSTSVSLVSGVGVVASQVIQTVVRTAQDNFARITSDQMYLELLELLESLLELLLSSLVLP